MLDNVEHTSNGPNYLEGLVPGDADAENYVDHPNVIRDNDIVTAPAPAPASFAAEVLMAAELYSQKAES